MECRCRRTEAVIVGMDGCGLGGVANPGVNVSPVNLLRLCSGLPWPPANTPSIHRMLRSRAQTASCWVWGPLHTHSQPHKKVKPSFAPVSHNITRDSGVTRRDCSSPQLQPLPRVPPTTVMVQRAPPLARPPPCSPPNRATAPRQLGAPARSRRGRKMLR